MSALAAALPGVPASPPLLRVGRAFVHPLFDLLIIGSGLSLLLTPLLLGGPGAPELALFFDRSLPWLVLLANSAHFASSTVRLYTKPGALREWPFLTFGFPLLTLGVLTLSVAFAERIGAALQALYLGWSPYHYAAQAYGLSLMYAYRSGCSLRDADKKLIRLACLLPFVVTLIGGQTLLGTAWLEPRLAVIRWLIWAAFAVPVLAFVRQWRRGGGSLPLISLAVLASNAVWLTLLSRQGVFAWATVFHGLQYLAIVTIFHVKDQLQRPGNRRGWAWHTASFYLACLGLGYLLFQVWPFAYVLLGFGVAESMLMVAAVINLHHFIVDGFIWKLRQAPNLKIVTDPV